MTTPLTGDSCMEKRLIPFLGALCMLLSAVEYAIPKPVPFMRLGLANLPVLIALYLGLRRRDYAVLVLVKVLSQALVSGTFFSYIFLFSAAGSFSSASVMYVLHHFFGRGYAGKPEIWGRRGDEMQSRALISAVGLSLAGALANNVAQLILSYFVLFGDSTRYVAPVLLIAGAITAVLLGLFAESFMNSSTWFRAVRASRLGAGDCAGVGADGAPGAGGAGAAPMQDAAGTANAGAGATPMREAVPGAKAGSGAGVGADCALEAGGAGVGADCAPGAGGPGAAPMQDAAGTPSAGAGATPMREEVPGAKAGGGAGVGAPATRDMLRFCASLILMIAFLFVRSVPVMMAATLVFYVAARIRRRKVRILPSVIILITVTAAALLSPVGRVLFTAGSFPVTLGALETGLRRALTLIGMVFLSQYGTSGSIRLPGRIGTLMGDVFSWFGALSSEKLEFRKRRVIPVLDAMLNRVWFS